MASWRPTQGGDDPFPLAAEAVTDGLLMNTKLSEHVNDSWLVRHPGQGKRCAMFDGSG